MPRPGRAKNLLALMPGAPIAPPPGGSRGWQDAQARAQAEIEELAPDHAEALEEALQEEWEEMVVNLEAAGYDLDERAHQVWETASLFLKFFLVSRATQM